VPTFEAFGELALWTGLCGKLILAAAAIKCPLYPRKLTLLAADRRVRYVPQGDMGVLQISPLIATSRCRWRSRPQHLQLTSYGVCDSCKASSAINVSAKTPLFLMFINDFISQVSIIQASQRQEH